MITQMVLLYEEMENRLGDGFSDESTMKMVLDRICAHFNDEDRKCLEQIYTTETPQKQELAKMERGEKIRVIIAVGMFAVWIAVFAGTIYKLLTT